MRAVIGKNGTVSTVERQRMWLEELNRKHILYFGCHTGLGKTCQAELLAEKHYKVWRRIGRTAGVQLVPKVDGNSGRIRKEALHYR